MISLPQYDQIYDRFHMRSDPERAVAEAITALRGVRDGLIDPVPDLASLFLCTEIAADGRGGDAILAVSALRAIEFDLALFERNEDLDAVASARLRMQYTTARAAAHHRAGDSFTAFRWCTSALTMAESHVGGRDELVELMAKPEPGGTVELAVAFLPLYAASLRRAGLGERTYRRWVRWGRDLVRAYVQWSGSPAVYPRTPALAIQWMYLLIADGSPEDADLVEALYALDVRTRPRTLRAEATTALRDFEIARYRGDLQRAERERHAAIANLERAALDRHLAFIARFRYFEPRAT
jgi:hypothetical protein